MSVNNARPLPLAESVRLDPAKILNPDALEQLLNDTSDRPVLVVLAAGKGSRFGSEPKCIQLVRGKPLARHTIESFQQSQSENVVCLVGYRHLQVAGALGMDVVFVRSDNPVGGTAFAAYESLVIPALLAQNRLLVITMGDRIVTPNVFSELIETHKAGHREADLTFLTAIYEPPRNCGKGRVLRNDKTGYVKCIVEQKDIDAIEDEVEQSRLQNIIEGNCPLYVVRAATLVKHLGKLTNDNAQNQFYLTDIIKRLNQSNGEIRTITTSVERPDYDLLCADVTRPSDLALMEGALDLCEARISSTNTHGVEEEVARKLAEGRPAGQIASIARQLNELYKAAQSGEAGFELDQPVAISVVGGRLRIAFMHPDMVRFYGPAWQMPIGASDEEGDEQIVLLAQPANDGLLHIYATNPKYREIIDALPAANGELMFPGDNVADWHSYEAFGTRMSECMLLALGYFSDRELEVRREMDMPLPPPALWVSNNMRRPFSLIGNAITSLRTLREGALGAKVQHFLGRDNFNGMRFAATGGIPQGGFSSSSALTLAVKNALNALYDLGISPDILVHLATQAEYGTGVRAGTLDQATEQKGCAGQGTLLSSNPSDNYRTLGTYSLPSGQIRILFPYSVARDREAWRWSSGVYAEKSGPGALTAGEMRKLTGKAAEIAAILLQLPLDTDFFKIIEEDLLHDGKLDGDSNKKVCDILKQLPLLITQEQLRYELRQRRGWLIEQMINSCNVTPQVASQKADTTILGVLSGWHDPLLRRHTVDGELVEERGIPLRAIVAYLFAETVKNFQLINHPEKWIQCVQNSQHGDRCLDIDPELLPDRIAMESALPWERGIEGPELLNVWLKQFDATFFDYNRGLNDEDLINIDKFDLCELHGSNFFRGLALIDLAEAMLLRAFGADAIAVRINAAGQGDFFQLHVDIQRAQVDDVKQFLRAAFFRRFGITAQPDIVDVHPGGGANGIRLDRLSSLPQLAKRLRMESTLQRKLH